MEKKIKIKSISLNPLNEALQKLKLNDTIKDFTPVIVEADGKFTSILNTKDEFNPNDISSVFETEEVENEEQKETKEQLLNKAKDALKQTLTNSKELNSILQKIQDLSKETGFNTWELNKEKNTASLKSKNATIFKQNNNLCLSHNGKIELFKSVPELHKWLKEKGYPLPGNDIVIHESVEVKEEEDRNWLDLLNDYNAKKKAEYTPVASDKNSPDLLNQSLGKPIPKEILQADKNKKAVINPNRKFLRKDTNVDECCGGACVGTAALGPAVAYTATKKKNEEKEDVNLQESFKSLIPGDNKLYSSKREVVNKFLTWYKRNKPSIESGEIKLPSDIEEQFDSIIEPTFLNNASDSVSRVWSKLIINRLTPVAQKLSAAKKIPEEKVLAVLMDNPNQQICDLLSAELNSYIPNDEEYNFGKVELVPGNSLADYTKDNPNYQQRKNWQKAYYQAKNSGKIDKTEVMIKTFNDLKKFIKKPKIDASQYTPEELELIQKYNLGNVKTESIIFESAKNYPWLNKILGQRLTEDDSPADFATGSPISSDMDTSGTATSTSSTADTTSNSPDVDISSDLGGDTSNENPSFGDINISTGYSPDDNIEEAPVPINAPEYKIIDVLINDDNNDIKVKLQDIDTKETKIKDLEDIDV